MVGSGPMARMLDGERFGQRREAIKRIRLVIVVVLAVCIGCVCFSGCGGPTGPGSPFANGPLPPFSGALLDVPEGHPVANATMTVELTDQSAPLETVTDAGGHFEFDSVTNGSMLAVQRSDGGQNVYHISVSSSATAANARA